MFKPKKKDKKEKTLNKLGKRQQQSSSPPVTNTSPPEFDDFQMV